MIKTAQNILTSLNQQYDHIICITTDGFHCKSNIWGNYGKDVQTQF